jgi:hypothetical protein
MQEIALDISTAHSAGVALTADQVGFLVETAGRAPSVHSTQPWQFRVQDSGLDLYADQGRRLRAIDPAGREMLISCGAAVFGLWLGLRHLRYRAAVELLPDPRHPSLLARALVHAATSWVFAALNSQPWDRRRCVRWSGPG